MTDFQLGVDFNPPDADQRRIELLERRGAPGIVVLGHSQFRHHRSVAVEHTHAGCLEIVLCRRGALVFENNGRRYELMPGDLLLNRPGERHRLLTYPKGLSLYWMLVRVTPLGAPLLKLPPQERQALRRALLALTPRVRYDDGTLRQAFAQLFAYLERPRSKLQELGLSGTALHLLLATLRTRKRAGRAHVATRLEETIEQIRRHPGQEYRIDDLAHQAALSPSRYIERFKQITGMPPRHFLLDCRLKAAKQALSESDIPITRLAMDLAFNSSQHFASTFKRTTGLTPSQWRAQYAKERPAET